LRYCGRDVGLALLLGAREVEGTCVYNTQENFAPEGSCALGSALISLHLNHVVGEYSSLLYHEFLMFIPCGM
jgi:hypothetical protein